MTERNEFLVNLINKHEKEIREAERWLWEHPQTGYTEWEAHNYLAEQFESLGYELVKAGNIPGFYADIDTGRPGPKICLMGELDALEMPNHPEAVNGMAHACGHNAQGAAVLGLAYALKEPGALDGMCGSVRLMMVPAEEMIQLEFREELRKQGVIRFMGGKPEFIARGFFDDVDIAMMVHGAPGSNVDFLCFAGHNGCIAKTMTYKGKASHAGGAPQDGINAQYAAMLGLQACNDLRETFVEKDQIRFHPILKGANCAVNIIPDEMKIESFVRGKSMEAMIRENKKMNRAMTGGALSMGAKLEISDRSGYSPDRYDKHFLELAEIVCKDIAGEENVKFHYHYFSTGSTDFADITKIMPGIHIYGGGALGHGHGNDYLIPDGFKVSGNAAKAMLCVTNELFSNNAAKAKEIIDNYEPTYKSSKEYVEEMEKMNRDIDAVIYEEDGSVKINL